MSLDDVAKVLGISESSVYRLVRGGELPRVKVGNRTLFAQDDVRTFIASRREAAADNEQGPKSESPSLEVTDD